MTRSPKISHTRPANIKSISQDEFCLVLQELAQTVEAFADAGEGTALIIKPSFENGERVIRTRAIPLPNNLSLYQRAELCKSIADQDGFHIWGLLDGPAVANAIDAALDAVEDGGDHE